MISKTLKVLCLGDVVGRAGRSAIKDHLRPIQRDNQIDLTIVNCENASGGIGLEVRHAYELKENGIDVLTLGDHTYAKKDLLSLFEQNPDWIVRPANYPEGAPGLGCTTVKTTSGIAVTVANMLGRVFMGGLWDCPFKTSQNILRESADRSQIVIFDFHCEATSEKISFGRSLDGKASLVFGTHTHVQTADESILAKGTAYITDVGMCGSNDGVIGMDEQVALFRFITGRSKFYEAAKGPGFLNGVICEIDSFNGRALKITRVQYPPKHSQPLL